MKRARVGSKSAAGSAKASSKRVRPPCRNRMAEPRDRRATTPGDRSARRRTRCSVRPDCRLGLQFEDGTGVVVESAHQLGVHRRSGSPVCLRWLRTASKWRLDASAQSIQQTPARGRKGLDIGLGNPRMRSGWVCRRCASLNPACEVIGRIPAQDLAIAAAFRGARQGSPPL